MKTSSFFKKLKDHATMFLVRQVNPPPLMLVSIYTYLRLQIQLPDYMAYTFFTLGVIFAVVFSYNHFFFYSFILNNGLGYWSILNLFLGLLGSNQKWKLYLYLFIIGDAITIPYPSVSKIYLICCTLHLWLNIYRNLIFKTLDDNLKFFMIFFTIFVFELCSKIISVIDGYWQIAFFTVPFSVLIAYKLLTTKIQKLKKKNIFESRDVEQINHYVSLIKQQIKSPYTRQGYIQKHIQNCYSLQCFCRNPHLTEGQLLGNINFKTKVQYYFIRNLYETALQLKGIPKKQFLQNKFIEFLIQNNQITQAIQLYTKLQCLSAKFYYFRWVQRTRLFYKIQQKLLQMDYFNIFNDQFIYAFKYDNSYLYLASQIKQILKKKIIFWNQVGKQNPYMIKLQKYGSQIVQKMYNLNNFYYQEIKEQQEKINNFNGTIIYAMYLLSTTNYKQYAQSLIKNTSRTLQSIKIHQDNIAETFGLRVIIRDCNQSCNQKIQVLNAIVQAQQLQKFLNADSKAFSSVLTLQREHINKAKKLKQFYQGGFVQIISNVSGSLCKLLKTSKNNLLGTDLNKIIPASYQQKHHLKLQKLLHVQKRRNNKQLINLSFINRLRHVPLKTFDNKLISTKINVKIFQGIDDNLSFIALIQTINQNKVTLITDLSGNIQEYEEGLNNFKILECEEVSSVFSELRTQWENNQQITTKKVNVTYHENNYSICFSSPYQTSFIQDSKLQKNPEFQDQSQKLLEKEAQTNRKQVPIHIDITNESIPYLMNGKQDREEEMTKCIKKMESVFYKTDIDSQSSTNSSRKSSVVNVLMTFSENYFIPFYGYIIGVFALILIGSIVANSISYSQLGLAWDNTVRQENPIVNIISVMYMRSIMLSTVSHQLDLMEYQNNPLINKSNINYFYGLDKTQYPTYVRQWTQRKQIKFKEAVSSTSMYISDVYVDQIQKIWQTLIPTVNPNNPSPDKNTQLLPIQNIFMNYIVDMDLLSLGRPYSSTIISFNFYSTIEYILSQISPLFDKLDLSIKKSIAINIVFCSILAVVICLSIIPLYILFKKRIKRHIDIYDLIVSVQGQLIKKQVKKLENIVTIVNNSNQSSQVLKSNTINYLARKRISVNQSNDGSNQMIEGLIDSKNNDSILEKQDENYTLKLQTKQSSFLAKSSSNQLLHKQYDTLNQKDGDYYQKKLKTPTRIRSGQLDLKNSEGDNKKIVFKHFILYVLIIVSCFGLVSITISKIGYFSNVKSVIKQITSYNNNLLQQKLLLLNAKMFFRGMDNVNFTYHNMNYLQWLQKRVYQNFVLNFNSKYKQQQPLSSCWNNKNSIKFLFCKQDYSILTLRQQIDQYIKQSYQKRLNLNEQYNISTKNMTKVSADKLKQMSQHFFYVQSMMDHMANYTFNNINHEIQKILRDQTQLNNELKTIYIIGLIWGIICLFTGIILINYMKKLYFNQIIIVSFLNTQMISKNKRVQSFLQTLSKSSY